MGGAVSSGCDNNELVDNLMSGNYIRTRKVEKVFRALDRAEYMTPESWDHAYKDLAWRNGPLHLSSPCIYSEVMEALELSKGLSFLNIGSGTGYLSSLVGLILGSQGINHGIEVHPEVYEYSLKRLALLLDSNPVLDDFDFCVPKFYNGNGLCLEPLRSGYDRVYCGAACPTEYESYFRNLLKVGGILVMPLNESLVRVLRVSKTKWEKTSLLSVTFAGLRVPTREEATNLVKIEEQRPPRLEVLCRGAVRAALRAGVVRAHPELRERARPRPARARASCPRRICIPVEPPAAVEGLNVLHDLDAENGADEMNALLSLVISMGHNRVAGALRFDRLETPSTSSSDSEQDNNEREPRDNNLDADQNEGFGIEFRFRNSEPSNDEDSDEQNSDDDDESNTRNSRPQKRLRRKHNSKTSKGGSGSQGSQTRSTRIQDTKQKRNTRSHDSKIKNKDGKTTNEETENVESAQKQNTSRCLRSGTRRNNTHRRSTTAVTMNLEDVPSTSAGSSSRASEETCQNNKRKSKVCQDAIDDKEISKSSSNENSPTMQPAQADTEFEESKTDEDTKCKQQSKRQKLDSGIGESTPGSSSPTKIRPEGSNSEDSVIEDDEDESDVKNYNDTMRRALTGPDPRHVRLSQLMRHSVLQLPLPPPLKKFVNLNRADVE